MADEAIRASGIRGAEDRSAPVTTRLREAVMHIVRRVEPETAVPMLGVVPRKEIGAVHPRVLEGTKPLGEIGAILEGLELGLREGIVVRDRGA